MSFNLLQTNPQAALDMAMKMGGKESMEGALEKAIATGANVNTKMVTDKFGQAYPIHLAAKTGSSKAVSMVLKVRKT